VGYKYKSSEDTGVLVDSKKVVVKKILRELNSCCTSSAEFVHIYSIKTAAESFENVAEFECLGTALTNQNCTDE